MTPTEGHEVKRKRVLGCVVSLLSLVVCLLAAEGFFRLLESRQQAVTLKEGVGGTWEPDPRWGWKPRKGTFREKTPEFDVHGSINELWMNDVPFDRGQEQESYRILALGDSHTQAVGVSVEEAWPKVLEAELNARSGGRRYRVLNAGCSGYSLHQYALRLIDQGPVVRPQMVVVGFSFATDLYDLLPPDRGGWIYGGDAERLYFDFETDGRLTERHWKPGIAEGSSAQGATRARNRASEIRELLNHVAAFRILRRSSLALYVGSRVRLDGASLWPNMDVLFEDRVAGQHEYQWRLAEALMGLMKNRASGMGARLTIIAIPYLPQVYDEVWDVTFGRDPSYDRYAANRRLAEICARLDVPLVDSTQKMRLAALRTGRWQHYRSDAHPTPEGQRVIADAAASLVPAEGMSVKGDVGSDRHEAGSR